MFLILTNLLIFFSFVAEDEANLLPSVFAIGAIFQSHAETNGTVTKSVIFISFPSLNCIKGFDRLKKVMHTIAGVCDDTNNIDERPDVISLQSVIFFGPEGMP